VIAIVTVSEADFVDADIRDLLNHGAEVLEVNRLLIGAGSGVPVNKYSAGFLRHLGIIRTLDEALARVSMVEALGFPVVNNPRNWLYANSKTWIYATLARAGIPVPDIGFGEVFKPDRGFMGIGIVVGSRPRQFKPIIRQRLIRRVAEYRVVVVGEPLGVARRVCSGTRCNVAQGGSMTRAVNTDVEDLATRAAKSLGLEIAGVDVIEGVDGLYVLDVNASFSWQGFKRATGIDVAAEIIRYLKRY